MGLLHTTHHDKLGEKTADLELHVGYSEQSAHLLSTWNRQAGLKEGGKGEMTVGGSSVVCQEQGMKSNDITNDETLTVKVVCLSVVRMLAC